MKMKTQSLGKKQFHLRNKVDEPYLIHRQNKKIIRISNIVFRFHLMLHKLIKFVHVDIGKKLGSKIPKGNSLAGKSMKTFDNRGKKRQNFLVLNIHTENIQKNIVIYTGKKFLNVAF